MPGRAGWELRAVVQAALSVLAQTRALGPRALATRPVLRRRDARAVALHAHVRGGSPVRP